MNKIPYKIKFNLNSKTIHKMILEKLSKFMKTNKLYKINIKSTLILKYNSIIINFNNLKKINNYNNRKITLLDHLMNFLKIYMEIISVNNKYLQLLLIHSKKTFTKLNNNLINNLLQI